MVGWIIFMKMEVAPLTSDDIVRFEFAGTKVRAEKILSEWSSKDWLPLATHSLYLDFIFIFLYAATLALSCLTFPSLTGKPNLLNWGMRLYRFSLYAGLADFLENLCLFEVIYGTEHSFFPAAAWAFALIKFSIIIIVLLFLVRCLIHALVIKLSSP
jgi:hypothetical protein